MSFTNFGMMLYRLVVSPQQAQITYQLTVSEINNCTRNNASAVCSTLEGMAVYLDPEVRCLS